MNISRGIFKAYDVRGTVPDQLNADVAYAFGRSVRSILAGKVKPPRVVVGSDARLSSPALKKSLIRGLVDSGVDVDDIGLVSTPTFYLVGARYGYSGGIQVSASHNPKHWNGFKVIAARGVAIGYKQGLDQIERVIADDAFPKKARASGALKRATRLPKKALRELAQGFRGDIKPFKIVFDGGNGMGGIDMKALLGRLPCTVVWMNEVPDGSFPAHPPDPLVPANTEALRKRVVSEHADLGIASDGDGDRYFFFDETGDVVPPEIVRGLMARIELAKYPGATIVYDVRPGKITKDLILEAGGRPVLAPVGHSLIKEVMIREGAVFGGESSGHFFYKLPYGTFEVPLVLVHAFLSYLSRQDKPLSEVIAPFRRYFNSGEHNVRLMTREEGIVMIEQLKRKYESGEQSTLDGLSVEYPTFSFNVRLSNTEPLLRFIVESSDKSTMERIRDELRAVMVH